MNANDYVDKNLFQKYSNHIIYGKTSEKYRKVRKLLELSDIKKDKRLFVQNNKNKMYLRKTNKHIEVDMKLLGCNAKSMWNDIFTCITQVNEVRKEPLYIMCINFEYIHPELLDIFYSYMIKVTNYSLYFILVTDYLTFIPSNIMNICRVTSFREKITSQLKYEIDMRLMNYVMNEQDLSIFELRDILYTNMIYSNNLDELLIVIYNQLLKLYPNQSEILMSMLVEFYKLYYNNYRSIYHLESILVDLSRFVHEHKKST